MTLNRVIRIDAMSQMCIINNYLVYRVRKKMQIDGIHEEYSYDRLYRFVVCRKPDYFEVCVQKKVIDEYLDPDEICTQNGNRQSHRIDGD